MEASIGDFWELKYPGKKLVHVPKYLMQKSDGVIIW
jgi:hypothetical protein